MKISLGFNSKQIWLGINVFIKILNLILIPFIFYLQLIATASEGLNIDRFRQIYLTVYILGSIVCIMMIVISFYNYMQVFPSILTLLFSLLSEILYFIYLLFWTQIGNFSAFSLNSEIHLNVSILFLPFLGIPIILMISNYIQYKDARESWIKNYLLLSIVQDTKLSSFSQFRHQVQQYKNLKQERELLKLILKDIKSIYRDLVTYKLVYPRDPLELTRLGTKILKKMNKSAYFYNLDYLLYSKDIREWTEPK